MKTITIEKSNDLRHKFTVTKGGKDVIIKIRLNDECHNGHQDFSITGEVYQAGKRGDRNLISAGCCHEEILKARPDLKLFVDLHLSTAKGVPMYAIENGFYFLKNGGNTGTPKEVCMDHFRINEIEFDQIAIAEDSLHLQTIIEKMGLPARWEVQANQAIKLLEEWTGKEFVNDSVKEGYKPLTDKQIQKVERKIESGYYSPEQIEARTKEKAFDDKRKKFLELEADKNEAIKKATDEFNIQAEILRLDLPLDNFIYYNHTNECHFNWNAGHSWSKPITEEQLNKFIQEADYSKLPNGIAFRMHKDFKTN